MNNSVHRRLSRYLLWMLLPVCQQASIVHGAEGAGSDQGALANTETEAVSALLSDPVSRRAFSLLESENARNVRELIELTEIPAPPFNEGARATRFAAMLRESGLDDVTIDEVGNVIGVRPGAGSGRTVALVAHLDTVFPAGTDVTVRREGDTYFAPGIGDNSRGLVMVLSLVRTFEALAIETDADILFVGSVGEEGLGDLRGVKHLFREGARPIHSFIAVDGGRNGRLVNGAVGSNRYRVTVNGPGGHSWGAFGIANPHHAIARGVTAFIEAATPITATGDKSSFSVGRSGGGTSINSIASAAWIEVDMRSGTPAKLADLDAAFRTAMTAGVAAENAARRGGDPLQLDLASVGRRPAGHTSADSMLVRNAISAMAALGMTPTLTRSSTDANIPMSLGIPAVTISRGGVSRRSHSPDESWQNVDSHLALQAGFLLLLAEAGLR